MEPILTPLASQSEQQQSSSSARTLKQADDKSINAKASSAAPRGITYKEKFQALRERFAQVNATNEDYKRELTIAEDKVRRLQEECNLLLDAVDIAVPAQPSLLHYLSRDPIPPQYHSYTVPFTADSDIYELRPPPISRPRYHKSSSSHTNGNGIKRKGPPH